MRTLGLRRLARISMAAAAVIAAVTPALAATEATPPPERLSALSAALDSASFVRVFARRGTFEARRALADSAGVHVLRQPGRTALIVVGGADTVGREERLLRWSDVERIDSGRGPSAAPAIAGLVISGVALGAAAVVVGGDTGLSEAATLPLFYAAGLVAVMSTVVGLGLSASSPRVHTVYP